MGYIIDSDAKTSQEGINPEKLLSFDNNALSSLQELNKIISELLSLIFMRDARNINLPTIMYSTLASKYLKARPRLWEITLAMNMLGIKTPLWRISAAKNIHGLRLEGPQTNPQSECKACSGRGRILSVESGPSSYRYHRKLIQKMDIANCLPPFLVAQHKLMAKAIDRMRGEGVFDDILRCAEQSLLSLQLPIGHYSLTVESTIHMKTKIVQSCIGLIRLTPRIFINVKGKEIPVSSKWEAQKISGKKYPERVLFFQACPVCLGRGTQYTRRQKAGRKNKIVPRGKKVTGGFNEQA